MKVLFPRRRIVADDVERFLFEARVASQLDHPYAAHIYASGAEPDRILWIAMELVRGTALDQLLKEQGPMSLERVVPLIQRIAEVVHSAHEKGIIHRDIKPANVMVVSRAGRLLPKLLDFGIAKLIDGEEWSDRPAPPAWSHHAPVLGAPVEAAPPARPRPVADGATVVLGEPQPVDASTGSQRSVPSDSRNSRVRSTSPTRAGAQMGSPAYMSPEQWLDSGKVDARTDIYALAALTYAALTGRSPFHGSNIDALRDAHLNAPVPPLGPRFAPALDAVIARGMAKDPAARPGSALEFAAELVEASGLEETSGCRALDPAVEATWIQRAPAPLAESVAALAAARNPHQALELIDQVVAVACRTVGLYALACGARVGRGKDDEPAADRIRALRRGELSDRGWLELARAVAGPFDERRELHPVPELVDLVVGHGSSPGVLDAPFARSLLGPEPEAGRPRDPAGRLKQRAAELTSLLASLEFLLDYPLVVAGPEGQVEHWMGRQRSPRLPARWRGALPAPGEVHLTDADGAPLAPLAPLFAVAEPTPGGDRELFLLDRPGPRGAILTAAPFGFEREDDGVWAWLERWIRDDRPAAEADTAERTPYRGLASFRTEDADFFFGREREAEAVRNRLRVQPLVAIVGPSGAGKSSFVKAGVVPGLPAAWAVITIRPGPAPLAALSAALCRGTGSLGPFRDGGGIDIGEPITSGSDPVEVGRRLRRAATAARRTVLLVVDQLEELFTLCQDRDEQTCFAAVLAAAAGSPADPVRIVVTLRDDFLTRAEALAPLRHRIGQGIQLLATPGPDELERIIAGPAGRLGYVFDDPALVGEMVREVADAPGALPLLAFAMGELWQLRDRHYRQLTRAAHRSLGGVVGALADHAEGLLASLPAEEQRLVREAFRVLVTAEGTRAVVARAELIHALGDSARAERVIERLVGGRLLVASDGAGGERIEVVHEALLTAWSRLVAWREEDAGNAKLRDQLRSASEQWHERGRPRGLLWRDEALAEYRIWRARYPGGLTATEEAFASASLRQARRGRTWRQVVVAAAFVTLSAGTLQLLAMNQESDARLVRLHLEQGREAVAEGDVMRGLVYLGEAYREGAEGTGLDVMLAGAMRAVGGDLVTVRDPRRPVGVPELSPDGALLLTSGDDQSQVWDARTGALLATIPGTGYRPWSDWTAFDPASARVALLTGPDTIGLWNPRTGALLRTLRGHTQQITEVRFSPDGRRILSASADGTARVWDGSTGAPLATMKTASGAPLPAAAWSPDGQRVVAGDTGGAIHVWDAATGAAIRDLAGPRQYVRSLVFSPDGAKVAAATWDAKAWLWDAATGALLFTFEHDRPLDNVAFDATGARLVTSSQDRTARIWSTATGAPIVTLEGHTGPVFMAAFSRDGARIATVGGDETVRLWDAATGRPVWTFVGARAAASFDPTGQRVATGRIDGTATVWDARQSRFVRSFRHDTEVRAARFSPDGTRVLTAGEDRRIRLWDARTGAVVAATESLSFPQSTVTWSHDGKRFMTLEDKVARIRDAATMQPLVALTGHTEPFWGEGGGDFSPDGRLVVTASQDRTARVWDATTGAPLLTLEGHTKGVTSAVFDPSGRRILTTSTDNTARIWDASTGRLLTSLEGHSHQVNRSAFHPDGDLVVTSSTDGTARLWDAADGALLRVLDEPWVDEASFSPDGRTILTSSRGGAAATMWDVSMARRSPEEVASFIRCRIPFRLDGEQLARTATDPAACGAASASR